jgi:hypothetical protein
MNFWGETSSVVYLQLLLYTIDPTLQIHLIQATNHGGYELHGSIYQMQDQALVKIRKSYMEYEKKGRGGSFSRRKLDLHFYSQLFH